MPKLTFHIRDDDGDRRVDRVLRRLLPQVSLARLYRALREGDVRINGGRVKPATRTHDGDRLEIESRLMGGSPVAAEAHVVSAPSAPSPSAPAALPPLTLLHADTEIVVVAKPAGLPVHGQGDTVMRQLQAQLPQTAAISYRPGPVHQLDRITSGVLIVGTALAGARRWSQLLRDRAVLKLYIALVQGRVTPPAQGTTRWQDHLGWDRRRRRAVADAAGAAAETEVWAVASSAPKAAAAVSLLVLRIHTGRRHQIRAQAALRGHPLVGDRRYGAPPPVQPRLPAQPVLHAALVCGAGHQFRAPLPAAGQAAIEQLLGGAAIRAAESQLANIAASWATAEAGAPAPARAASDTPEPRQTLR